MKKIKTLITITVVIAALFSTSIPVFAFSQNESRSVENFFIDTQLLKGDGTGYGLEKAANRLEGIIILVRLMGKEADAQQMKSLPCQFTDVPDWAKGYVNYAYAENISKGVSDTRFGVNDKMTASQYNTLLLRVLGYDDSLGDFQWEHSVNKAEELSVLPNDMAEEYIWDEVYTKGDLMETSFCYLEADLKDQKQTLIDTLIETNVISDELAEKYGLDVEGWDSITTGLGADDYLNFQLSDSELTITGTSEDKNKTYLLVRVINTDTKVKKADQAGRMNGESGYNLHLALGSLPKGEYYVDVYGNDEKYHYYTSTVLSSLILKKTENDMYFEAAPVYGQNLRIHNGNQLEDLDSEMTPSTKSTEEYITAISDLSGEITGGISDDYEKVQAIHDWVAENIYYDKDFLNGKTKRTNIKSISVLNNRYAVCSGYANLTNDLLAAAGIPSREVLGYALGVSDVDSWDEVDLQSVEPNHVWNEAYVGGRWIIVDTTWDSSNTYEGEKFTEGEGASQLYFDVTVPFLSNTHKVIIP
ncbi:MAG TPA: transglutaminase domain-containing protein [Anaerovoracaceae bacterium]|nr:transglutaminase domain-containing protein [Anaerovoracaceae bacterium]